MKMQQHMINQARMSMRLVFTKMIVVIKVMKMTMIYLVAFMFMFSRKCVQIFQNPNPKSYLVIMMVL